MEMCDRENPGNFVLGISVIYDSNPTSFEENEHNETQSAHTVRIVVIDVVPEILRISIGIAKKLKYVVLLRVEIRFGEFSSHRIISKVISVVDL